MSYDRYGNRYIPQNGQTPNIANNHDGLHSYDAAGNVTDNGAYTYDAEGNLFSSSDGMQRFYDSLNRLVYQYNNNYGYGRLYSYGLDNKRRGVFDGGATKLSDVIYANGQPVAYWDRSSNSYNYQYQNQVGTDSGRENNGNVSTFSSLPFGDDVQWSGQDNDIYHYAGLDVGTATTTQWDQSTLEHAQFREYSPFNGHWFSPDPYDGSYDLSNPQSLNRYTYVLNNPLQYADPTGQYQVICDPDNNCYVYSDEDYQNLLNGGLGTGFSIDGSGNIICADGSKCGTSEYEAPGMNYYLFATYSEYRSLSAGTPGTYIPQHNPPSCGSLAFEKNGTALTLDAAGIGAGFVPGGEPLTALVSAASGINSAVNGDASGAVLGVLGVPATYAIAGAKYFGIGVKAIPGIGAAVSALGLGNDIQRTISDYHACMAGRN